MTFGIGTLIAGGVCYSTGTAVFLIMVAGLGTATVCLVALMALGSLFRTLSELSR